jgi:hypothetical protein
MRPLSMRLPKAQASLIRSRTACWGRA